MVFPSLVCTHDTLAVICELQCQEAGANPSRLISMDSYGSDVYISLNKLSSSREPLP